MYVHTLHPTSLEAPPGETRSRYEVAKQTAQAQPHHRVYYHASRVWVWNAYGTNAGLFRIRFSEANGFSKGPSCEQPEFVASARVHW